MRPETLPTSARWTLRLQARTCTRRFAGCQRRPPSVADHHSTRLPASLFLGALTLALIACGPADTQPTPDQAPPPTDASPDASPLLCEGAPLPGQPGGACNTAADAPLCYGPQRCIREERATAGGASDPIVDLPVGAPESFEVVDFFGDYCAFVIDTDEPCSDADRDACASACGVCANTFRDGNVCLRACSPSATDNDTCRNGYDCDLLREGCDVGCLTNLECRVTREDTNGDGVIEPYDVLTDTGDRLVYHPDSQATCSLSTFRCEHPGLEGALAGDPCVFDEECEANGKCLDELRFGFEGGYCSKYRCDLEGNACAGDESVCMSRGVGFLACLAECSVGTGVTPGDTSTYLGNTQGCRQGYTCVWDGVSTAADARGGCLPGEFNALTLPNVGAACSTSAGCYSPLGQGLCLREGYPGGYCAIRDCGTPGMPLDVCGDAAVCVELAADSRICMATCETAEDCRAGYACGDIDGNLDTPGTVCFPDCLSPSECRAGEDCVDSRCQ